MWKVYKRTVPNGKVYIGITKRTLEERMANGYQNNHQFALDIIKYGKENIVSEILEEYDDYDTAIERELHYIQQYKDICYNKVGNSHRPTHSNKHKPPHNTTHRASSTKPVTPKKVHKVPLTTKPTNRHSCPISVYDLNGNYIATYENAKTAAGVTGINHGDIVSCCRGVKADGKPRYQCKGLIFRYAVDKLDEFPDVPVACKKVNQYTLDGEYIRTFNSLKDAWLHTGASIASIGRACKGTIRSSGGFIWQYADESDSRLAL